MARRTTIKRTSRIPLAFFLGLMHTCRFSLTYLLIFLSPDRASRSRDIRWSSLREVADDADEVYTREQGAWRLPELKQGWKQTERRSGSMILTTRNGDERLGGEAS